MTRKRIRIDVEDAEGGRYDIRIEGKVNREKVIKIFDMLDMINIEEADSPVPDTVGSKIWGIVEKQFPIGRFTSTDILEKYEDEYNAPIKLSIISTYLSRFAQRGRVNRARSGRSWTYQIAGMTQQTR
ncbi:hypothetical protein CENSYa_1838 [Cenarchaeum symbiosum A]|uniref:Uncharacterized protein n=1 Tax=Cenarchaeum symbiosum (strain A) TaxID=414004 RepID=A0RYN1_CENSY|nr:hypothetical protein CENSYa_1838 [Cenarchaeum symbiosum A]